jgi:hypothetical protein
LIATLCKFKKVAKSNGTFFIAEMVGEWAIFTRKESWGLKI